MKLTIQCKSMQEAIVRCKDCKHRQPGEQKYMCMLTITEQNCKQVYMKDDDFCSYGEKREYGDT